MIFDWLDFLTFATIVHDIVIYIPIILVGFHEKWLTLYTVISFSVIFVVIYIFIWLAMYRATKNQIQSLNQKTIVNYRKIRINWFGCEFF